MVHIACSADIFFFFGMAGGWMVMVRRVDGCCSGI
jgi:hypothetical protein